MSPPRIPGAGIFRTFSGRTTYYPDGVMPPEESQEPATPGPRGRSSTTPRGLQQDPNFLNPEDTRSPSFFDSKSDLDSPAEDDEKSREGNDVEGPHREAPHAQKESERDLEKQESPKESPDNKPKDPNLIDWDGPDDPENPMNFPLWRKWMITMTLGLLVFAITFASSVFSTATVPTAALFHVSQEVMILGTSLFVAGFAVGPPIWGPLSELFGRKAPMLFGYVIFGIFQIPVAVAQNIETVMLCRFFGGLFGSAPLAIVGGTLADFWDPVNRGIAIAIFAGATFLGPVFGPIIGGFVTQSYLGWRWTEYLTAILAFTMAIVALFVVPETFGPVLLQRRAKRIRYETRNWAIHSKMDESRVDFKSIVNKYLVRSFVMLVREPILVLITIYMALIYGILYLFFEAYPIAFQEVRGWNEGVGSLPFLAIIVGVIMGGSVIVYTSKTRFARKLKETGRVVPEERLIPMIIGGAVFPAGLFWFAWTSHPGTSWIPQVIAGAPIGMGVLLIFLQGLNYIIDVYMMNANSAIAANTFVRSLVGAGFPMFATGMYHRLGVDWATSLLGFLTAALFPVPILFYIYGARIRKLSRYSPT